MKVKIWMLVVGILLLTCVGCQKREEQIENIVLKHMEGRYGEKFEVVDINYNKSSGDYEVGLQTEKIKNGYAVKVSYSSDEKIFDNYYARLYCAEVTESFKEKLDSSVNGYVYTDFKFDVVTPLNTDMTFEEFKIFGGLDSLVTDIKLYCSAIEEEKMKTLLLDIVSHFESAKCDISVYFVTEEEISDIELFIRNQYLLYDDMNLMDDYEYVFKVTKRDGEISLTEK